MNRKTVSSVLMCISVGLAVLLLALSLPFHNVSAKSRESVTVFDGTWKITCHDTTTYRAAPAEISNPACLPVYMETELPDTLPDSACIMFYTVQSEVRVWLFDALIYEFAPPKSTGIKLWPPSRYHIVDIGDAANALLKIEITPTLPSFAGKVPLVYCGQQYNLELTVIHQCLPTVVCCLVLFVLTACILAYGTLARHVSKRRKKRMRSFAWCVMAILCWSVLEQPIKQFIFKNYILSFHMLEISYFSIPVFFSLYTRTFDEIAENKVCSAAFLFSCLQFIFVQIAVLLGVPFTKLIALMQTASVFVFLSTTVCVFRSKQDSELRTFARPFYLLLVGLILELLRFFFITKHGSGFIITAFCILFVCYYYYLSTEKAINEYTNSLLENYALQTSLEKTRVDLMLSQIRPHFLYNTLTSIQTIVKVDPDYAYDLLFDFSRYLRSTINSISSDTFIPFKEELETIKAYIHIEKMRFGDLVSVKYDIAKDDFPIVPLSIQPIVENAVKHGLDRSTNRGISITISSFETDEACFVAVADTGMGFDTAILSDSGASVGISNITYRLEKQMNASVDIISAVGEGTTVTVKIPKPGRTE